MSELGPFRKSALVTAMSAFTPIATKLRTSREVRFVPKRTLAQNHKPLACNNKTSADCPVKAVAAMSNNDY